MRGSASMTGRNGRKEPEELSEWRDQESFLRELQKEAEATV